MRTPTSTIWKTVVFAGAMLGASACKHKSNTPDTTADMTSNNGGSEGGATYGEGGDWSNPDEGYGDPCEGRSRGGDDEGGMGRGFILS